MQTLCLREERAHVRGRALQAVEHALGLPGDVLDVLREVTLRGGEQVAHAVCERVDRVDAALHGGERVILALDQTGQGVKLRLQAEELFAQLLRGLLGGLRGGAGLTVKAVAPVGGRPVRPCPAPARRRRGRGRRRQAPPRCSHRSRPSPAPDTPAAGRSPPSAAPRRSRG